MDGLIAEYIRADAGRRGASGVLYVEDFDEPPACARHDDDPVVIAPGYTAEDVEAAREEGRQSGLEEGRTEHAAVQQALCAAALAAIGDALANGRADAQGVAARGADEITSCVLALLTAVLPATAARLAVEEVGALLAVLLPPLRREPGVSVRVHPDVLPRIGEHLGGFKDLTVVGDAGLAPPDVVVAWRDGEAQRDWPALWRGVTEALAPFGLPGDLAAPCAGREGCSCGE